MTQPTLIFSDEPTPVLAIKGRGRKVGSGANFKLLNRLKAGQSIWEIPKTKMESIRATAHKFNIEITIRRIPDSDKYAIWRK